MSTPHGRKAVARAEARLGVTTDFTDLSLHSASANGNLGLVKYALLNGQPVNSVLNGVLPLHAAASSGNEPIVRMLIEHGADVNSPRLPRRYSNDRSRSSGIAVGTAGSTPLHFAAANGHSNIVSLLLTYGAKPSAIEKYGQTPEMLASQKGHSESVDVLRAWIEEEAETASSSGTGHSSSGKHRRIHPQRSFDAIALKLSQHTSNNHLPNLHFPTSGSSTSINSLIPAPSPTTSNFGRRASISSQFSNHLFDSTTPRRPSLPSVFEKAAHPTSALKHALGMSSIRRGSVGERSASLERKGSRGSLKSFFGGGGGGGGKGKEEDDDGSTEGDSNTDRAARRRSDEFASSGSKAARRVSLGSLPGSKLRDPPGTAPPTKTSFYPAEIASGSSGGSTTPSILSGNNSSTGSLLTQQIPSATTATPPAANPFYRPRQSSQLSGRVNTSPLIPSPSSPRVFEDDEDDQDDGDEEGGSTRTPSEKAPPTPDSATQQHHQRESSATSSARATPDSALMELTQKRLGNRDRTDSLESGSSTVSRRNPLFAKTSSLHPAEGVYGTPPVIDGKRIETRSSRSNSAGTDGRFSSSPASSYSGSGPGALSTYAPSSTTTATSAAPSSPTSQFVARQPLLAPLYEASNVTSHGTAAGGGKVRLVEFSTSRITTSAEAHTRVKKVERELLNYNPSESSSKDDGGPSLTQQLAAYGQSLSLERKLKALESGKQPAYTFETIASGGTNSDPIVNVKPTPSSSNLATSSTLVPKSLLRSVSADEATSGKTPTTVPQWRAIPSSDRLMPPPTNGRRSTSPSSGTSTGPSGPRKSKSDNPTKLSSTALNQIASSSTRTSSPSSSSNGGANGISYVEVVPPSSTGTPRRTHHHNGVKSGKGSSVTSAKDQVIADAVEQARIESAIPSAKLTVPKKPKGFRALFSSSRKA